ncbi:MAG: metallophosphoesterase [bacterium]|nr:metallophosphoesterase [bacterium]
MKLWAISDPHFSGRVDRNMNAYGEIWVDHETQIKRNWQKTVKPLDIVMIGGDISWATKLDAALVHLRQFNDLPGRYKILVKGNHDHWWKKREVLQAALPPGMLALQGSALEIEGQIICGTRGWLAPNDPCSDPLDGKTYLKEMGLLKAALDQAMELGAQQRGMHLLMHFPPFTTAGEKTAFWKLICQYPVRSCSYGHFHMQNEWESIPKGMVDGIACYLTASDYITHTPQLVADLAS